MQISVWCRQLSVYLGFYACVQRPIRDLYFYRFVSGAQRPCYNFLSGVFEWRLGHFQVRPWSAPRSFPQVISRSDICVRQVISSNTYSVGTKRFLWWRNLHVLKRYKTFPRLANFACIDKLNKLCLWWLNLYLLKRHQNIFLLTNFASIKKKLIYFLICWSSLHVLKRH